MKPPRQPAYTGIFDDDGEAVVYSVGDKIAPLPFYHAEKNHSPDGFSWGYHGSGPAQLAYALIRHATGDRSIADKYYQRFKDRVVAGWDQNTSWTMTRDEVLAKVREIVG